MHASPGARSARGTTGARLYWMYVVALVICLLGNLFVRIGERGGWLPGAAKAVVALLVTAPLVVAVTRFGRLMRDDLDEMLQRIVLEGLASALVWYVPLAALYVNLRAAGVGVPRLDAPDVLLTPAFLVALGIAVARRRYQ